MSNYIVPVVLCGGKGGRLWPFSFHSLPKQFVNLPGSKYTLLQNTVSMVNAPFLKSPILVTQKEFATLAEKQCTRAGVKSVTLILEEEQKGTAIATLLAALYIKKKFGKEVTALVVSVDSKMEDYQQFIESTLCFLSLTDRYLIVFGAEIDKFDRSYGYIKKGEQISDGLYKVTKFIEKPTISPAEHLLRTGKYFCNSGNFMFNVELLINMMKETIPNEFHAVEKSINNPSQHFENRITPNSNYLENITLSSLDKVVIEGAKNIAVHKLKTRWHDLGNIYSLWENRAFSDQDANYIDGNVKTISSKNNYISTTTPLTTIGISDAIIINTGKEILISNSTHKDDFFKFAAQNITTQEVEKPWGYYSELISNREFKIKKLVLNPLQRTSLQQHQYRSETLCVLQGEADVVLEDGTKHIKHGESVNVAKNAIHRIENNHKKNLLVIIEVQIGDKISEDDIVRLQDDYDRVSSVSLNDIASS